MLDAGGSLEFSETVVSGYVEESKEQWRCEGNVETDGKVCQIVVWQFDFDVLLAGRIGWIETIELA